MTFLDQVPPSPLPGTYFYKIEIMRENTRHMKKLYSEVRWAAKPACLGL